MHQYIFSLRFLFVCTRECTIFFHLYYNKYETKNKRGINTYSVFVFTPFVPVSAPCFFFRAFFCTCKCCRKRTREFPDRVGSAARVHPSWLSRSARGPDLHFHARRMPQNEDG